ncbi:hypothetical protein B0O99DRAFT_598714 [Bisporella sp. PMI_857]|nr:hypothetical protein B0O99DRAFT_598714 [Bisporella sp. PMI_857]
MGTVILTGANSSVGIPAAEHLLKEFPELNLILTVRNTATSDQNTFKLREVISRHPNAKAAIYELDLANLKNVETFASKIASSITTGELPPLKAIVCNAFYWNLLVDPEITSDGFDKTLQVAHISHVAIVLRLLGQFDPCGRIVLFSSTNHIPGRSPMEKYPPYIPLDLDTLVHPRPDKDKQGRGFERYSNSKLVVTTWMYALNRYLEKDAKLSKITAVAINPGNLGDSRAFTTNTPNSIINMQRFLFRPFLPILRRFIDKEFRTSAEAGVDVAELAANRAHPNERGYFNLLKKDKSAPQSLEEEVQQRLWVKSTEWANITKRDTALEAGLL